MDDPGILHFLNTMPCHAPQRDELG